MYQDLENQVAHTKTRIPRSTPSGDQEQGVNHVAINIPKNKITLVMIHFGYYSRN